MATSEAAARIQSSAKYQELVRKRSRFGWALTIAMLAAYFGYIALIAFDKAALATPVGDGTMSWGVPIGLGLIVFTVALTGVYVWRANAEFDALTKAIVDEAGR